MATIFPQIVFCNVSDDHRFPAKDRRAAGPHTGADFQSIDHSAIGFGETGSGAMPEGYAIKIEEKNRAEKFRKLLLHELAQAFQDCGQRSLGGDEFKDFFIENRGKVLELA